MAPPKREQRTALDERVEWVLQTRGYANDGVWCVAANLSPGYLKQMRFRAVTEPEEPLLPEKGAAKLAEVARVRVEWLRFGRGPREEGATASAGPVVAVREPKPAEVALVEAFALGAKRYTARDFLAALDLVRGGEQSWGATDEERLDAANGMLSAVARVRKSGQSVTWENVAGAAVSRRGAEDPHTEGAGPAARARRRAPEGAGSNAAARGARGAPGVAEGEGVTTAHPT